MPREPRTIRRLGTAAALTGVVSVIALLVSSSVTGSPGVTYSAQAGHKCLVMTGSGDPAFTKNFNPYAGGGLPTNSIAQGAFYEPLIAVSAGGVQTKPWLARSWKWSNRNKTLTLALARNAKWSDGTALTSADVVYSLLAGRQDKTMDRIGITGAGNNIASIRAKGKYGVAITLKSRTRSSSARRSTARSLYRSTSGRTWRIRDLHQSEPRRIRAVQSDRALHHAGLRGEQEPELLAAGAPEDRVPRVRAGELERRCPRSHPERPGRLDAQLRPERRAGIRGEGPEALPLVLFQPRLPDLPRLRRHAVPVQPVPVPQGREPGDRSQDRLEARRVRVRDAADATRFGLEAGLFPDWVTDPALKKLAAQMATYNPTAAKKTLTDAGFTYKGSNLIDPKGNPVQLNIHVISGWSDWVASNQIITKNLRDIGIDSQVKLEASWGDWFPNAFSTKNPTLLWQVASRGSPYGYFYANLHPNAFIPSGQDGTPTGNWEHFASPKALPLLNQWKSTLGRRSRSSSRRSSRRSGFRRCR